LCEPFLHCFVETFLAVGFEQIVDCVSLKSLDRIFIKCRGEDHCRTRIKQFQHFETVDLWHLYVQKNQIWLILCDRFDAFESVVALGYNGDVRIALQLLPCDGSCQWFVVDQYGVDHDWGMRTSVVKTAPV